MRNNKFFIYLRVLRVNQWIKNLVIFTAIIFSGQLFNAELFFNTVKAFFIFCLLSSSSYILNDIIDYPFDKKHSVKKYRPIASGEISMPEATFAVFILTIISLLLALFFSTPFFIISFIFVVLHFFYSLYLKSLGDADIAQTSMEIVDTDKQLLLGKYKFGENDDELFEIKLHRLGWPMLERKGKS